MARGSSSHALNDAIKSIYDAALDWHAWPAALDGLADAVKGSAAQFGSYNAATLSLQTVMPRIDPDYATSFVEHWASRNTVWQQSSVVPVGQVMRPEMFFAPGGWRRTDFFNEWYRPQRLDSLIGTNLLVEGPVSTVVSVLRKEPFARAEIELFTLLIPHVQRAVQLQLRLSVLEDKQSRSAEVLNRLPQGVLLVDAAGKVRFANRAAEGMLADGAGLRVAGGVVQAARTDETCILRKAIASSVDTAAHGAETAMSRVRLSRSDGRRPLRVLVIPLRPQAPWTRLYQPSAILFVNDPERDVAIRSAHLRDEFGLTRAEAALALEILAGQGLQVAAGRLQITLTTARTHLAHIFEKTGTRRQAELVRLILHSAGGIDQ
jgi:DNA-binding CsgD family transcriptional regulator